MRYVHTAIAVVVAFALTGCAESVKDPSSGESKQSESTDKSPSIGGGKADKVPQTPEVNVPADSEEVLDPTFDYIEMTAVNTVDDDKTGIAVNIKEGTLKKISSKKDRTFELDEKDRLVLIRQIFNTEFRGQFYDGFDCAQRETRGDFFVKLVTKPMGQKYRRTGGELKYTSKNKNITRCVVGEPQSEDAKLLQDASKLMLQMFKKYANKR